MSFALNLKNELLKYNLLNHPFYQMWNMGEISVTTLQDYAKKYLFQVSNFPTYISATHSITENLEVRKILTENLADEELNGKDHASLWKDFCYGLGLTPKDLEKTKMGGAIAEVVKTCKFYASKSSAAGLGILFGQEHNYSEVAKTKGNGLKIHYRMEEEYTKFFTVHEGVDIWHAEQIEKLLNNLTESEQKEAQESSIAYMKLMNYFLDEMLAIQNAKN